MDDVPFFYVKNEDEGTNTAAVHNFITPSAEIWKQTF